MRHTLRPGAARIWPSFRLLLAATIVLWLVPAAQAESAAAKRAAAQFVRAEKQRTALHGKPKEKRTFDEYMQVLSAYHRVYLITAHAKEVPAAYIAVAEVYREMGRRFDPKYFQSAIDTYRTLLQQYPNSRYRDDAMMTIAQIEKDDLIQLDAAQISYQEFLKRHANSPKAPEARKALSEIEAARSHGNQKAEKKLERQLEKEKKLPEVTQIRTWNAENYTRVVIDVEDQVKYQGARIADPDRIYFDIHKVKLSSTLAGKTLDVQSGFLKTIRVAQNQAGIVRVVLEVDKVKDYSVFLLPNPYRLIVDVYGKIPVVAKAERPPLTEAAQSQKAESTEARHVEKSAEKQPEIIAAATETAREPAKSDSALPENRAPAKPSKSVREAAAKMTPPPVPQPNQDGQRSLTRALGLKIGRIVIDAGHGGQDTGTIGPSGLMEKDLCLDIALRLGKIIQQRLPGAEVIYTREDDTFIPLENRTALANQTKADMFISIHANSSRDHSTRGVETYYLNFSASPEAMEVAARENSYSQGNIHDLQDIVKKIARNEKIEESRELAADIQDSLSRRLQRVNASLRNRGVRKAPFVVLIGANMPSVLSEVSFISNPADEKLLKKPENRQRVAEGLYHGLENYLQSIKSLTSNRPGTHSLGLAHAGNQR